LVVVYRIDDTLARDQAQWFVIGLILFVVTILALRDFRVLERYRYTIAAAGLALLLLPRVPGIGQQVNGAYLGVGIGPVAFQPAEFGKLASVTIPPLKHFGPLLVVFFAAMFLLFFIQDLGSSLMYFGGFLALLYVATNRISFVLVGLVLFAIGAWAMYHMRAHIQDRVEIWLDPFKPSLVEHQ